MISTNEITEQRIHSFKERFIKKPYKEIRNDFKIYVNGPKNRIRFQEAKELTVFSLSLKF